MRTYFNFGAIYLVIITLFSCSTSDNSGSRRAQVYSLEAAIAEICITDINFRDHDNNVYAYRADDLFKTPSIQAGGHSDADENTDLGANLFGGLEAFATGDLTIDEGSGIPGTAYVFYIINGEEFISTDTNTGNLNVSELELREDGSVKRIKFTFNNVEVANTYDPNDKLCINLFELEYSM